MSFLSKTRSRRRSGTPNSTGQADGGSKPTQKEQDDEDDQDDTDDTDPTVTVAVAVTADTATEATKQEDDKDNNEYESQRHGPAPSVKSNEYRD
jgi:hypothetical protein